MSIDTFTMTEIPDAAPLNTIGYVEPTLAAPESQPESAATVAKVRQVLESGDARALKRGILAIGRLAVGLVPICLLCQQAKRPEVCQWARQDDGSLQLECGCTVRVMQGVK